MMFLGEDLLDLFQKLLQKFIKNFVIENTDTVCKVSCVDEIGKKNHRSASDIDIGFAAKIHLTAPTKDKKISDRAALEFKMDC